MTTTYRAASRMAILALLSPLALFAQTSSRTNQDSQDRYQDIWIQHNLQIQVKELGSDQVIATVEPGGTITLREGQRVRLIMTADRPGRGRGPIYPETEFTETEPGRGWVRVTRTNEENANATLQIVRPSTASRSRTETLRYRITEDIGLPSSLREGTILVRAEPAAGSTNGSGIASQQARDLTRRLYRAILMREPDASGSRRYVESITSGGYPALVRVADQLAKSDESRIRVYEREGVCNEQRLLSLFKNLLDLSAEQIDRKQWDADLSRMRDGQMDAVVEAMVRSTRFQQIHNLERVAIRY
jgi:hypothetical protein